MGKKKWKVPKNWGMYIPDEDEKGFNPPKIAKSLDELGKWNIKSKKFRHKKTGEIKTQLNIFELEDYEEM